MKGCCRNYIIAFLFGLFLFPQFLHAQFFENFSDADFTVNPEWRGNTSVFKICSTTSIPTEMRPGLQLDDTDANTSFLTATLPLSSTDSLLWTFWAKLSFNPSASNYARFYLISESADLTNPLEGFFVSIGEISDKVSLYQQTIDSNKLLIEGPAISKTTNVVRVKVKKNVENEWEFSVDTLGNNDFILYGTATVPFTYFSNSNIGMYCKYTKSNSTKIFWDDISVQVLETDTTKPYISSFDIVKPNQVILYFSEELDLITANNDLNYSIQGLEPIYAVLEGHNKVTLSFFPDFEDGVEYTLTVRNIKDKAGNAMLDKQIKFNSETSGTTKGKCALTKGNILINEVLFNPLPNGSDFVEIYNNTSNELCLDSLCLATWDDATQELKTVTPFGNGITLASGGYLVITKDKENILVNYHVPFPEKCLQLKALPAYPDKEGVVILCTKSGEIIDRFAYSENMHFQLLSTKEGVSLERRSFSANTNDASNWQSASKASGWATPTYKNSQYSDFLYLQEPFTLGPNPFSPNLDGIDDFLNINYRMNDDGLLCNITIFDSKGRLVRHLKRNEFMGKEGTFVWDGITEQKRKAPIGNYVVLLEVFDTKGNVKQYKEVVTVLE